MTQTVNVIAGYDYDRAQAFIEFLVGLGFSVTAEAKANVWSINAHREIGEATWVTQTVARENKP